MKIKIGVFGLGYVGLPLAIEFGKIYDVVGYDIDYNRINSLKKNIDYNKDIPIYKFLQARKLKFTSNIKSLENCNTYIITVPTPITSSKKPDLKFIINASKSIGKLLKKKDTVIIESTVYPGLTEEICLPVLEKISKLKFNRDFYLGYSPERVNPNDKKYTIENIIKITSGSNKKTSLFVDNLYKKIIKAGTYRAESIKVAEAAKVIENSQRDINIAFMNELCLIFDKLGINTDEVLKAASTKWNFVNFKPGIVGGHCIGVDPYYLTHKSKKMGYNPKIITSGRKINDEFINFILKKSIKYSRKKFSSKNLKFLVLGLTFKENCVDYRNSQSIRLVKKLKEKNITTHCFDPLINIDDFNKNNKLKINKLIKKNYYHCCIISVAHKYFKKLGQRKIENYLLNNGFIFDVKNILPKHKNNIYL
tara:strand:- start:1914 stop:3176 length:1263 start_codon:yes stop_codon:yes gene_type:complete